jgi:hypothetical protein
MYSWIKKQAKSNCKRILSEELKRRISYIGLKNTLQYFFMQRVLRINSHVPWPVH